MSAPSSDQDQRRQIPGMRADQVAGGQHDIQIVAADDVPQHQHAGQQAQAAGRRDDQRHARAAARIRAVIPVGDQHEGREAGQLPEHHELDQIAREHHAEHRAHEGQKEREKARHRILRRHVVARVQHDQRAHDRYQHREQPCETVHAQREIQAQRRRPGQAARTTPSCHLRVELNVERDAGNRNRAREPRCRIAGVRRQKCGAEAAGEWQNDDPD